MTLKLIVLIEKESLRRGGTTPIMIKVTLQKKVIDLITESTMHGTMGYGACQQQQTLVSSHSPENKYIYFKEEFENSKLQKIHTNRKALSS